jgi:hypothetical protein
VEELKKATKISNTMTVVQPRFEWGKKETSSVKEACSAFLLTDGCKHKCFMPFFGQFRLEEMKLLSKDVYIYCEVLFYHHQAAVLQ